jgi:hypothetical protein
LAATAAGELRGRIDFRPALVFARKPPPRPGPDRRMTAPSPEKAMDVQTEYVKSAYEAIVAQATKIAELYADLGKECYKPFVGIIGKKTSMS